MTDDDEKDGMSKKSSSGRPKTRANTDVMAVVEQSTESCNQTSVIALCHRTLRIATGVILGAFVLIIAATTVSTGRGVQFVAQALYYVILAAAIASLTVWLVRVRMEKRMARDAAGASSLRNGS